MSIHQKLLYLIYLTISLIIISLSTCFYVKVVSYIAPFVVYFLLKCFWGRCFLAVPRA
jgi:hypothetical protein